MNGEPHITTIRGRYAIEWGDPERAILELDYIRADRGDITAERMMAWPHDTLSRMRSSREASSSEKPMPCARLMKRRRWTSSSE